jgi:hypothetical protein
MTTAAAALPSGETQPIAPVVTAPTTTQPAAVTAPPVTAPITTTPQTAEQRAQEKWGESWRQDYAGQDAKMLARLERYQSPKAAIDALIAAQNKISAGELVKPLSDNPTAEEVAAWRTQNGIPEKPEGYLEKLPNGLVVGEEDKAIVGSFLKDIHAINADPRVAHAALKWYTNFQEQQVAERQAADLADKTATEDKLRADMGADYRANVNHIQSFLSSAPSGVSEMLANARGPDGKALFNNPDFVNWMSGLAREINPVGTIVGGVGGGSAQALSDEIAALEKEMGNRNSAYWKGSQAEAKQARYRDLITAKERVQARG